MSPSHELEIEMRKVVRFDLEALRQEFPTEWAECVEAHGDDAVFVFVTESWLGSPDLFESTVFDDVDYHVTELNPWDAA